MARPRCNSASATSPQLQAEAEMVKAIREAGRTPVQRITFYERSKSLRTVHRQPIKLNRRRANPKCWRAIWRRHSLRLVPKLRISRLVIRGGFPRRFLRSECGCAGKKGSCCCQIQDESVGRGDREP